MSVCGIDFGNLNALIAQAGKGGVDMVLNGASLRQTATCMSFQGKQRFFGDAAASMMRSNIKNTIDCMKLLVGRNYDDADVQLELSKAFYKHCKLPSGGVGIIVDYNDEETTLPVEHVMAMMLTKLKDTVLGTNGIAIGDAVLAVPSWFTDSQRKGVLHAAEIAELNCLKIVNEGTAVALSYGIYKSAKKLFSETEPVHCMFVDVGYTCYTVTLADFVQEKLIIRSSVCDRELGGRDFDDVIIEFMAEQFQTKTGIDVRRNAKALRKLQAAAEKAKKTLSPAGVTQANISVECLAEDTDLNCILTLAEFETRCASLLSRLEGPILEALGEAQIDRSEVAEVELVGGSVRINCIKKILSEVMGLDASQVNYGLKTTMNSDEAVARGAALQCAIESSRIKVKPFSIIERVQYPVEVQYTADGADAPVAESKGDDMEDECVQCSSGGLNTIEIYARGDELPRKPRRLTFRNKTDSFVLQTVYGPAAKLPPGQDRLIGTHTVKIPQEYTSSPHDVRVTFVMDKHGCVQVSSAQLMEELPATPSPAPQEPEENAAKGAEDKGEDKAATPAVPKRRFKKVDLHVETVCVGLTRKDIADCLEKEAHMANEDRIIIETADRRNELESYVYGMRDKLDASLAEFATNSEKAQFRELIDRTENWLYEDGFDSTKSVYTKKLDELKVLGNPIEKRLWEQSNRGEAVDAMKRQIEICKTFASDNSEAREHITAEEKAKVRAEADKAEEWLYDQLEKQGELSPYNDPIITVDSIGSKRKTLHTATKDIMAKPKPIPKKEEQKPAEDKKDTKGDSADCGEKGGADSSSDAKSDDKEAAGDKANEEEGAKEGVADEGAKDMEA